MNDGVLLWSKRNIQIEAYGLNRDNLHRIHIEVPFILNKLHKGLASPHTDLDMLKLKLLDALGGFLRKKNNDSSLLGRFLGDKIEVGVNQNYYLMELETMSQETISFFVGLKNEKENPNTK